MIGQVYGVVEEMRLGANAPGCDEPTIALATPPEYNQATVTWPSACVDPGERVELEFDVVGPVAIGVGVWSARPPSQTPAASPTPPTATPTVSPAALPRTGGPQAGGSNSSALVAGLMLAVAGMALVVLGTRDAAPTP